MRRRPRGARALAALVVVNLAVAGVAVASRGIGRRAGRGTTAPGGASDVQAAALLARTQRDRAVTDLLDRRAQAVLTHDAAEFMSTVDPAEPAFYAHQLAVFRNRSAVPFASWSYVLDAAAELPDAGLAAHYGDPVWVPQVQLAYELAGFDTEPAVDAETYTFVDRPQGWLIASKSDVPATPSSAELWDFGPVTVVRGARSLVLGHPGEQALEQAVANEVDRDVPAVSAVWGTDWSQRVVVLVPTTAAEFSRIISVSGDESQIAAVATAELALTTAGHSAPVGNRVVLNPPDFAELSSVGRTVVLTHEITHVATRSFTGPTVPTWLVEGFADYVGYLHAGLSVPFAAQELAAQLHAGQLPAALPDSAQFASSAPGLAAVYEEAWLACRLIAADYGQPALVRLYRVLGGRPQTGADRGPALQQAFATVLHTSVTAFTARWRAYLAAELG